MKKLIAASRLLPGRGPMKITRRFAVATLLVLAVAVVLGAPAPASAIPRDGPMTVHCKLYPAPDSPFPHATGTVTGYLPSRYVPNYTAVVVSVSKLAPNASYYMPVTVGYYDYWGWHEYIDNVPIQTDARGNGEGGYFIPGSNTGYSQYIVYQVFEVYDSSGTLVLTPVR